MSKVLLIDVDKIIDNNLDIPNLALMQISKREKDLGNTTILVKNGIPRLSNYHEYDRAYISCIFTKNSTISHEIGRSIQSKNIPLRIGGTGLDIAYDWLPETFWKIEPDYDLYPSTYSQGYTTRGCIRKCGFCVVPIKEGNIQIWQHPSEFHDERFKSCMLMDNNLFAAPNQWQESTFSWFHDNKIKMISPQGWDARLLTQERIDLLKSVKHEGILHFAWDNMHDEPAVLKAIELLKENKFDTRRKISFYVLCGYNTTIEQDVYRCQKLKDLGVQAYAMRYQHSKELNKLARWTARAKLFWKFDFKDYDRSKE